MVDITNDSHRCSIAVFPFLKTSAPVSIGGISFHSTQDTKHLTAEQAGYVQEIADMLFLQDDFRIRSASYAVVPCIDLDQQTSELEHLANIQAVVAYLYGAPQRIFGDPFLATEHASLTIFTPQKVSIYLVRPEHHVDAIGSDNQLTPDDRHEVPGYAGLYNFKHPFWVIKGSRVYGPIPQLTLNISQDLSLDLDYRHTGRPDYDLLPQLLPKAPTAISARILTAVRWFNGANTRANDAAAAIVSLAIAFETLLSLPEMEKTERLTDAISLLLGRTARLDIWARQFYQARSAIVHEGRAGQLRFVATDDARNVKGKPMYHSLLSYGRQVFQLCVATLLVGAQLAERAGLEEKLVTNQERFERLCKIFDDQSISHIERLQQSAATVAAIERHWLVWESDLQIETMLAASRKAAEATLQGDLGLKAELKEQLQQCVTAKKTPDHYEQLDALQALHQVFPNLQTQLEPDDPGAAALRLLEIVWRCSYLHYAWLTQHRKRAT